MKKENIVQYKIDELPKTQRTDWNRLDKLTDEEIDTSDIPELDEEWFKNAKVVLPQKKKAISLRLDGDVVEWFKSNSKGRGYQTFINAVLKAYVKAQKDTHPSSTH